MSIAYSIPRLPQQLDELAQRVQAITPAPGSTGTTLPGAGAGVTTGWAYEPEEPDPALERGVLHEWFGVTTPQPQPRITVPAAPLPLWQATGARMHTLSLPGVRASLNSDRRLTLSLPANRKSNIENRKSPAPWSPPLCILTHLARRGLQSMPQGWVIWIGKRVWPYPHLLLRGEDGRRLLDRSVWIDAPTAAERLWAIDQAVRCPAISVVVADGRGFNMPATRRLQLAARASSALLLLARPPGELAELSAAATRWAVHAEPSSSTSPRWSVELLRCKHTQQPAMARRNWVVELDRAQGDVRPAAHVVGRTAAAMTHRQTA